MPNLPVWIKVDDSFFDGEILGVEQSTERIRHQQIVGSQYEEIEVIAVGTH
jgi:hypothetical protein